MIFEFLAGTSSSKGDDVTLFVVLLVFWIGVFGFASSQHYAEQLVQVVRDQSLVLGVLVLGVLDGDAVHGADLYRRLTVFISTTLFAIREIFIHQIINYM